MGAAEHNKRGQTSEFEAEDEKNVTNIGAIIDVNSRIGKEQKAAMEVAAENFNKQSDTHELILHFRDSGRDPFLAAYAAKHLIKEQKVQVIIGMETWQEAITVADVVHNQPEKIPVISFAAPTITPPLIQRRWPFLIRMASDGAAQMECIGDIVNAYNWKRVVVIYEDNGYGGGMGRLALLSEALRNVGSKIEHRIVLPQLSESDTNWDELKKQLLEIPYVNSRAFIVLQSSLPTVTALFKVARKMGFVGADSAWIITESIASLLDPQGNYDMDGTLGMKTYYDRDTTHTSSYARFQKEFQTKYSEEDYSKPGIYALRAYDIISIVTQAISRMPNTTLQESLATILSNYYKGLSGKMQLKGGAVLLDSPRFRIINIVGGKTDNELNFWIPDFGFSESLEKVSDKYRSNDGVGKVIWPGNPTLPSKGWAMPTDEKPMKILLPAYHENFVRHIREENSNEMGKEGLCLGKGKDGLCSGKIYDGLSIDLFCCVLSKLNYSLPHEFDKANGTYNDTVELVYSKTYDAVIGDTTVLESRIDKVDFTQPYLESGLSMIVPDIPDDRQGWMFLKPFSWKTWVVTGGILIYTTLVVWFLEVPTNPDFSGSFKSQIAFATWFTFSSLFFAHREKVYSNLTRVVFVVWLFVVLILSSSYTANLSSMLTIQRLSPNVTDIEMLRNTNSLVGCDSDSFVGNYLVNVLNFNQETVKLIDSSYEPAEIRSKKLSAVFLELPYGQVFMDKNKGFTLTKATYSFGGFSFVFQKGSPIARDFSKVILDLLENGEMRKLQDHWLTPKKRSTNTTSDTTNTTSDMPESLRLKSFWGLFVISGATSTFCCIISLTIWLKKLYRGIRGNV
ncbi:glutamate receptor 2.7-like isoform X2 [Rosa rugosa]|uniref:glutamate receptor 2.7-like isoform X2 n=1 Tax=Rosa rugosa TaxID=74645 RepID=UPI002B4110E7|nr:glutamate receptor 2.7-like isoform X2 [Rosa rugosa]